MSLGFIEPPPIVIFCPLNGLLILIVMFCILLAFGSDNPLPNPSSTAAFDSNGNPSHTAGGTGGNRNVTLTNDNLPRTQTDEKVLVVDANGPIIVGGCQFDPDKNGPAYDKYREANAVTNATHTPPTEISVVQPYITVYRWMRIS